MATFGAMVTYVQKRLIDPNGTAVDVSDVQDGINDSIAYWKFRRFWFNEVLDTATLTVQDSTIPLPVSGFLVPATEVDGFYIDYGNCRYVLAKDIQQNYDDAYLTNGYGLPRWYARVGQNYVCWPIPDQAYTIGRHYLKDYPALVNATDTNDFSVYAARLIELWALANLSAELRQDTDMATYYDGRAQNEYRNLRVMTNKTNGSGKLSIYSQL